MHPYLNAYLYFPELKLLKACSILIYNNNHPFKFLNIFLNIIMTKTYYLTPHPALILILLPSSWSQLKFIIIL